MTCLICLDSGEVPTKWEAHYIETDGRTHYVGREPVAFDWCWCSKGQKLKAMEAKREAEEEAFLAAWVEQDTGAMEAGF